MALEQDIESIRDGVKAGRFTNEASVSQGIVLRLLHVLGWPCYDTQIVCPEYSLGGRRVDFALCHPSNKPAAFIEVKQVGQSEGGERQLFEYAFHEGVPMAILTDGREWNFFLPGEQGDYGERRVYKLDLVDRDLAECVSRLKRYLLHSDVASGAAIQAAREDYRNVSRDRQMLAVLPKAWSQIIADEDEMLLEIVADRVESLCGFKPAPDMVAKFLKESFAGRSRPLAPPLRPAVLPVPALPAQPPVEPPSRPDAPLGTGAIGYSLDGKFYSARNAIDVLRHVFEALSERDASFLDRFAGLPRHGRSRRYLARDASELYPGRPDLCRDCSIRLSSGWWLSTNHSKQSIQHIIGMALEVARTGCGKNLKVNLG